MMRINMEDPQTCKILMDFMINTMSHRILFPIIELFCYKILLFL